MDNQTELMICILPFTGKSDDWRKWSSKFIAWVAEKGYDYILLKDKNVLAESMVLDETKADGKAATKLRKANKKAYNDLLLLMDEDISFGIVDAAKTDDLPSGDARLSWKGLVDKFEPTTGAELIDLKVEFNAMKLESGEDPKSFLTRL